MATRAGRASAAPRATKTLFALALASWSPSRRPLQRRLASCKRRVPSRSAHLKARTERLDPEQAPSEGIARLGGSAADAAKPQRPGDGVVVVVVRSAAARAFDHETKTAIITTLNEM